MDETYRERAHRAWRNAERIKKLSDNLVKIGPWGLGLDGVLAWVPVAGTLYSVGSGALLLYEGVQARASSWTLTRMAAYMLFNSALSDVPIVGWAMDTLFRAQLMSANALQKDIEARHGAVSMPDAPPPRRASAPYGPAGVGPYGPRRFPGSSAGRSAP